MIARAVCVGWFGACLTVATAVADGRELRVADTHPVDYPTVQALEHMGRALSALSNARLTLKVLHSRVLGEEADTIEHVRVGALDMARVNLAPLNGSVPETVVPSLPFVFRSAEHLHHVLDGPIGAEIAKGFERHGFVALAFYDSGARSFYTARRPVRVPADLRGLRIRVQQSPVAEAMVTALGGEAVPLPYGQVEVALATGVIDGAENNLPSYHEAGHYRAAPYYSSSEHGMAPEVLLISLKIWNELSAADQAALRRAARESVPMMRLLWEKREQTAQEAVAMAGAKFNAVDGAAFATAMRPVYDRFAATPRQKDLLRRIQATE